MQRDHLPSCPLQRWLGAICLLIFLGACARTTESAANPQAAAVPSPTPIAALADIDPHAVSDQLTDTDSLAQASTQLAEVAGVPLEAIRVLIRDATCISCSAYTGSSERTGLNELTVVEAAPLLKPGSSLWLNVPPLACLYSFDGEQMKPQGCRTQ